MNTTRHNDNILLFCSIMNSTAEIAQHYLQASNNDMENAINSFLDHSIEVSEPHFQNLSTNIVAANTVREPNDPDELLSYWRSTERWEVPGTLLPEYTKARESIIITPQLMRDSTMRRALRNLKGSKHEWPPRDIIGTFRKTLEQLLRKAWPSRITTSRFRRQSCSLYGIAESCTVGNVWDSCDTLFHALGWERPYLLRALQILIDIEDTSGLQIIAGLMKRGAGECYARKRSVFYNIINRIPMTKENVHTGHESANENVRVCLYLREILAEYIDSIKDKAFKSTFLEPTKMYFNRVFDYTMEGDVEVHGANIYLVLLASTLGIALNRDPYMDEGEVKGVVQFMDANVDSSTHYEDAQGCWSHDNFGKTWESIPFCRNRRHVTRKASNNFYFRWRHEPVVEMGKDAADPRSSANSRRQFAVYLEQFCSYFTSSFILQRMFTHLTVEAGEEAGRALQTAYGDLKEVELQNGGEELPEDVRFYCWDFGEDLVSCTFNERNALKLFSYIGVC